MDWLKNYSKKDKARILVIDSDILMRLYNNSLSIEDRIEFASTGIAFEAHLAHSVFTYFEFFKGIKDDSEYLKRLEFLSKRFDCCLRFASIGFDDKLNPEYWLIGRSFNLEEFKRFIKDINQRVYEYTKKELIFVAKGVVAISMMVKSCLKIINTKCWVAFAEMSKRPEAQKSYESILNAMIDANFKTTFFNKEASKKSFDTLVRFSMVLFNYSNDDTNLFAPTTTKEIKMFLNSTDEECKFVREQNEINCKSVDAFCHSYLKYLSRNGEKSVLLTGYFKLIIDYINGRKISTNDLIDLFNISSITNQQENVETYYGTKEKYWNNEFIRKFAANEDKIWNCTILEWDN